MSADSRARSGRTAGREGPRPVGGAGSRKAAEASPSGRGEGAGDGKPPRADRGTLPSNTAVAARADTKPPSRAHSGAPPRAGLRERKKERTRRTIRTEAFRLFREQGYNETTVEQIADAAEVSPSTFFRYFPSKQELVLADDLDPIMIEAVERQPAGLSMLETFRRAVLETFASIDEESLAFERQRTELVRSVPELRGTLAREFDRSVQLIAGLTAARTGRSPDDIEVKAFSGALIGAAQAALLDSDPYDAGAVTRIMEFLAGGMRL